MRMNNGLRRLISMLMCLILVVGMLPSSALATEASPAEVPAAVTEPAATEAPAAPAVENPTAEEPAAEEPAADGLAAEEPAAEEPEADGLAAEEPAAEEPTAEEPAAEEPAAEEPAAEEPAAEEPATEEPAAEEAADGEEDGEDVPAEPAAAVISGTILWVNRDAQAEEARPASVTLTLIANGAAVSTIEVPNPGSETEWPYSFGEQSAQDAGGNAIAYTVAEAAPADYAVTYDGLTVINTYAPAPAEETDPVQELFDTLMAFETYEELSAYMDAMTEEQYGLLAQFTAEQNEALTGKIAALQENDPEVLPAPSWGNDDTEYTVDHIDIACDNLTANVLGETITFSFTPADVRNGDVEVFINGVQYTSTSGSSTDTAGRNQVRIDGSFDIGSKNNPNSFTVQIRKLIETENYGEVYVTLSVTIDSYWSSSNVCPGYQNRPGDQSGIDVVLSTSSATYTQLNIVKSVEGLTFPEDKTFTFDIKNSEGTIVKTVTVAVSAGATAGTAIVTGLAAGTYTVVERTSGAEVEGYKLTVSYTNDGQAVVALQTPVTVTVTNTYEVDTVDISGAKTWNDANDQDGKRPASITVNLLANGEVVDSRTVTADDNWAWTFTDMPKYDEEGNAISYTITEDAVTGYTAAVDGYNVTNTHVPEKTSISGSKTWNDANDQDGVRPASITVRLHADGVEVAQKTVTAADNWAWSFEELPVYAAGVKIVYTITEDAVTGYEAAYDGYSITNTHTPEETGISGSKTWNDANDQDGIRPASITIRLLADGVEVASKTVTAADNWAWSFTGLPVYAAGEKITYTIAEDAVAGYESTVTGYNVTNTHAPEKTNISGSKTWDDADDQDGKRPESITINLLADGVKIASKTVTEADGWAWSFDDLPKYENGGEIVYTITEDAVAGYTAAVDGYNVTNTHTPETVELSGSKTWNDASDQDGIRPDSITINLLADGEVIRTVTVTEADGWAWSFAELPKYRDGGVEILYTVSEEAVAGYETLADGMNVTNTHTPETTTVSGAKTWADNNDQDGMRPDSITIHLLADGEVIRTITVTEADGWAWSFGELPKYRDGGVEIVYTITEDAVDGYTASVTGYNVTNTHEVEKTEVPVTKVWNDNDDQDGIRPNDITVVLLANGRDTGRSLVLSQGNDWADIFTDLDKYAGGEEIVYTVEEITVDGYTTAITGSQTAGYTITNTHTPEVIRIEGGKTWVDADNQDGVRPASITINLLKNGEVIETITVTEADGWAWSFEDLPKYENHGTEIVYSITENTVENYSTEYDGYNVINSYTPAKTSVTVTKSWQDSNDQDGIRPISITVRLLADGADTGKTLVLSADNSWTGSFTELDKYRPEGVEIVYTVEEVSVKGYDTVITGDASTGYTITNSHTPEVIEIEGSKTWDDADNQDGRRPEAITIRLKADGVEVASVTVTEADGWAWSFTDLPKYSEGVEIVYAITEDAVDGYTTTYDGYNVTNKYTPEEISITVVKAWADKKNAEGKRPDEVTIILLADGADTGLRLILSEDNNWVGSFTDLPKYADGEIIEYTIDEVKVSGYNTVIRGSVETGFTVTNSLKDIPTTGDERMPMLWIGLMMASMASFAWAVVPMGKKKRR